MNMKSILAVRGIHFLATRFGGSRIRRAAFDEKYRRGDWAFDRHADDALAEVVQGYLGDGHLLIMGCGGAGVLQALDIDRIGGVLGIDLSPEAIRVARQHAPPKVSFEVADMERVSLKQDYRVILFSESIYYVPEGRLIRFLEGLGSHLTPTGVMIATVADPTRYQSVLRIVRDHFIPSEDRVFDRARRCLLVFRPKQSPDA